MNRDAPTIGLLGRVVSQTDALEAALGSRARIETWQPGDLRSLAEVVGTCCAVVVGQDAVFHGFRTLDLKGFRDLRLIVLPFAGHEWLAAERLPAGCVACNTYEHEGPIAEYVLGALLHLELRLDAIDARFRAGDWSDWGAPGLQMHGELAGKRLGVIGYGRIGKAVARRAQAFDMEVVATSTRLRPGAVGLVWHGGPERLDELLETSAYIVVACDLNDQTRNLLSADRIARLRRDAVLVNVARAHVVDYDALFEALRSHRIRGAVLDVWRRYPSPDHRAPDPDRQPFRTLENALITPHCSSATPSKETARWRSVVGALQAFLADLQPDNVFASGPAPSGGFG